MHTSIQYFAFESIDVAVVVIIIIIIRNLYYYSAVNQKKLQEQLTVENMSVL